MTDKEIIINGIDVSGCGYYYEIDGQCNISGMGKSGEDTFCRYCTDNPNCYYKKLKRLAQENAELKAENVEIKTSYINFIAKLKREMITKDDIQDLKDTAKRFVEERNSLRKENAELKAENEKLIEGLGVANKYVNKYHQTLQEIKEIAEALSCKHPEDCWENEPDWNGEVYGCDVADNWKNPSELATCPSKLASAILQIITKAEEK